MLPKAQSSWEKLSEVCGDFSKDVADVMSVGRKQSVKDAIANCQRVAVNNVPDVVGIINESVDHGIHYLSDLILTSMKDPTEHIQAIEPHMLEILQALLDMTKVTADTNVLAVREATTDEITADSNTTDARQLFLDELSDFSGLVDSMHSLDQLGQHAKALSNKLFPKRECALQASIEKSQKSMAAAAGIDDKVAHVIGLHVAAATTSMTDFRELCISKKVIAVTKAIVPLEKIGSGAPNGKAWHDGLAATATFLQIKKTMEGTIAVTTKPKDLTSAICDVAKVEPAKLLIANLFNLSIELVSHVDICRCICAACCPRMFALSTPGCMMRYNIPMPLHGILVTMARNAPSCNPSRCTTRTCVAS
jgi:hypothetical protein